MEHVCTLTIPSDHRAESSGMKELAQLFGKGNTITCTFNITNWEREAAEPAAGFLTDAYYATDVEITNIDLSDEEGEHLDTYLVEKMEQGLLDILKQCCIEASYDHPDWVMSVVDADYDRRYETLMEDRWERDHGGED